MCILAMQFAPFAANGNNDNNVISFQAQMAARNARVDRRNWYLISLEGSCYFTCAVAADDNLEQVLQM